MIYHYILKQVQKGIDDYNVYISLDPYNSEVYFSRGNAYKDLGLFQKALSDYTAAIDLDPRDRLLLTYRSEIYHKLGQKEKANADSEKEKALLIAAPQLQRILVT